jgi:hypothetical protein
VEETNGDGDLAEMKKTPSGSHGKHLRIGMGIGALLSLLGR